ncbi:hypothetical protein SAMN04487897_106157 [Paenibacillus sp. yr247]|uniref:SET domain-containing protein-lysine N-methyltransferase n=1 Tax=Paenibacillus sp. yr247 TaxID=1761880 RepID=UPI000884CC9D|nr:SET domain-containing protein-lysine N-methyltransferase [Paenibacillus sp. yr247]SDN96803.1 hypothetical protein SAMN04487897_106157 [Paenibacillus sp. yr247]
MNAKQSSENKGRFYPDHFDQHPNEPTKDIFAINYNPKYGEGVIAKTFFRKGELIFRFQGTLLDYQTLYTLQQKQGVYIEDPYFMGKILHCCDPNTSVDMEEQVFWAIKDIKPGDFITMDYESTEDKLFRSFHCQCGSHKCRKLISGKGTHASPTE